MESVKPLKPALPSLVGSAHENVSASSTSGASSTLPPYAHALAGGGAGLATVALLHPLDTLRTHMQSSNMVLSSPSQPSSRVPFSILRSIISRHGVSSLYSGLAPASLGSVVSLACYFHMFQRARSVISPYLHQTTVAHLISGAAAGVMTSIATNPIWVVKVRLQLQSEQVAHRSGLKPYTGLINGLVTIAREEGVIGLYRGLAPSLWLVSHGALQFTLYEMIKSELDQNRHQKNESSKSSLVRAQFDSQRGKAASVSDALVASTASKIVASVSTYPLQVARTRMQERLVDGTKYGSFQRALWSIATKEGIAGLYRGLLTNIMRVTPQAAVTFVTYEQILKVWAH